MSLQTLPTRQPANLSLTDSVRAAAARVAALADSVHIRHDRMGMYAAMLLGHDKRHPAMTALDRETLGAPAAPEERAAYVVALNAVNFGSGYFDIAQGAGVTMEYAEIALALRHAFKDGSFSTPALWSAVTAETCHKIFSVPKGRHAALDDLMRLFARHLSEAGRRLCDEYDGSALALVREAGQSAVRLAETVGAWPGFCDVAQYNGAAVPIYKRAQILAADMHLAFTGQGEADFTDLDQLTIFADNMVPHVLRLDGILEYAPPLAALVDAGEQLPAGSVFEVELRAVAIHAVECLKQEAQAAGHPATALELDRILWNRGYGAGFYAKPRHRTLTVWY